MSLRPFSLCLVSSLIFLTSCVTQPTGSPGEVAAAKLLQQARSTSLPSETRAADYLQAAALAAPELGTGTQPTLARNTYNAAAAELTMLLRTDKGGLLWNKPLTLTGNNTTYHLQLQPGAPNIWSPDYFNNFVPSDRIKEKLLKTENHQPGVGGSLVGIRTRTPREAFAPPKGIAGAVTATLDFHGHDATLALRRPFNGASANVAGKIRPLNADFSASVGYYQPPANLLFVGLMGALRAAHYTEKTGLYCLQPYDPNRIPVVFVHGLISTPFTWVETINGLQADPEIRKRYQFWVFAYPTGNPVLYSALRLREELARFDKLYPHHKDYVLIGHSMGGLLSRAQVIQVTRADWEQALGDPAEKLFANLQPAELVAKAAVFKPNPRIKRVVFVCTPHRGSGMASGGIGAFAIKLISLPTDLATTMESAIPKETLLKLNNGRLPNSVSNLAPTAPYLKVVNREPIQAPYHSIIGNKGKAGPLADSSDGVVPYWSSHMDGAKSEKIVPGPHGSTALPETIDELRRILLLHLRSS